MWIASYIHDPDSVCRDILAAFTQVNSQSLLAVQITEFWHELETATNQTYQELIAVINQHLLELARKIEGSVGKVLDLCLKPLDICLQRPSAEEFHSSIQDLLRHGDHSSHAFFLQLVGRLPKQSHLFPDSSGYGSSKV